MSKKVLVTGAGGSIGLHVANVLLNQTDWDLVLTDSFRHLGYSDRIALLKDWNPSSWDRVKVVTHDLLAPFSAREIESLKDVDIIINLASLSDVQASAESPVSFIKNNVDVILNMLELAREIKPEAFIQFSTDEVYGSYDPSKGTGHKEWDEHLPSNPYSASKAAQEDIAIAYWRTYDVPLTIINVMNNFGEAQSANKYPVKIQKAVEAGGTVTIHSNPDGSCGSRCYMHSEISAEAVLFILRNIPTYHHESGAMDRPNRFHVAGDRPIDNLELAQTIAGMMDKPLNYEKVVFHAQPQNSHHDLWYSLDSSKIKAAGFTPSRSFETMMKRTIEWQKDHDEWIKY